MDVTHYRVRIVAEGGGLEDWNDFTSIQSEGPVSAQTPYAIAKAAIDQYRDDVAADPDVIHPRALVVLVEPLPQPEG
jgi:hypothetical protein